MTDEERERRIRTVAHVRETLKRHEESHPHLTEFTDFLGDFNNETARAAVLAAAAFIDDHLLRILAAYLVDTDASRRLLEGPNAPLGTFSSKIDAACALGLISEDERNECDLIRKIRNEFAHKVKMSFDDARVQGLCSGLKFSAKPGHGQTISTRGKFTTAAVAVLMKFTNQPFYVGEQHLKAKDWPY